METTQVWTVIGAFSAVMFAALGMFARSLRSELDARFGAVETGFAALDAKLDSVANRLDTKLDNLASRLDAKIDSNTARLDAKIDNLAHVMDVRLEAVESDMRLVKGHLLGQRSA